MQLVIISLVISLRCERFGEYDGLVTTRAAERSAGEWSLMAGDVCLAVQRDDIRYASR